MWQCVSQWLLEARVKQRFLLYSLHRLPTCAEESHNCSVVTLQGLGSHILVPPLSPRFSWLGSTHDRIVEVGSQDVRPLSQGAPEVRHH